MFQNFKLTPAQQFVLHSLTSLFIGALVAGLVVVGQDAFTGAFDAKTVLLAALAAFGVYFTTHFSSIKQSPQTIQAALDTASEAKQLASQVAASHQWLAGVVQALQIAQPSAVPPPVTVHVTTTAPANVGQASESASASIPEQPTQSTPVVAPPVTPAPANTVPPAFSLPTISSMLPAIPRQS